MGLKDLFRSREERERGRKVAMNYLESVKKSYDGLARNIIIGSIQAIEDGESPERARIKIEKYLAQFELLEKQDKPASIFSPHPPYYKIRPTSEEIALAEKEAKHKGRVQKADNLYEAWRKNTKPVLKESIIQNPKVLDGLRYSTAREVVPHGGSFYDFSSQENLVKKRADGKYAIEIYPGGRGMGLEKVDDRGGEGYSISEVAGKVARGLLDISREGVMHYPQNKSPHRIPGRIYALETIKKLTGVDLRADAKKKSLENTLGATMVTSLFMGIFFLSPNMTGNAIVNITNSTSNIFGACLLVCGLITGFFWIKLKKK